MNGGRWVHLGRAAPRDGAPTAQRACSSEAPRAGRSHGQGIRTRRPRSPWSPRGPRYFQIIDPTCPLLGGGQRAYSPLGGGGGNSRGVVGGGVCLERVRGLVWAQSQSGPRSPRVLISCSSGHHGPSRGQPGWPEASARSEPVGEGAALACLPPGNRAVEGGSAQQACGHGPEQT